MWSTTVSSNAQTPLRSAGRKISFKVATVLSFRPTAQTVPRSAAARMALGCEASVGCAAHSQADSLTPKLLGTRTHRKLPQLTSWHELKLRPAFLDRQQSGQFGLDHLSVDEFSVQRHSPVRVHVGYLLASHLPVFIDFSYKAASVLMGEPKPRKYYI